MSMRLTISALLLLCFVFYQWLAAAGVAQHVRAMPPIEAAKASISAQEKAGMGPNFTAIQDLSLDAVAHKGSLEMSLFAEPGGEPLSAARVVIDSWEGQALDSELSAQCSAEGLCSFDNLKPGTYEYHIEQAGSEQEWTGQVELQAGAALLKRIDLSQLTAIR